MSREEEENAAELKFGDDFVKAKCLMNSEVAILLEHRCEQLKQMSDDLLNRIPQVFEKSLQYVQRFSRFSNQEAVKQLAEYELAVLGNLRPEAVDEALAVVPSLKTKGRGYDDETIEKMLNELALIKKFE